MNDEPLMIDTSPAFVLAGGESADGTAHILRVDKGGRVEAVCVQHEPPVASVFPPGALTGGTVGAAIVLAFAVGVILAWWAGGTR